MSAHTASQHSTSANGTQDCNLPSCTTTLNPSARADAVLRQLSPENVPSAQESIHAINQIFNSATLFASPCASQQSLAPPALPFASSVEEITKAFGINEHHCYASTMIPLAQGRPLLPSTPTTVPPVNNESMEEFLALPPQLQPMDWAEEMEAHPLTPAQALSAGHHLSQAMPTLQEPLSKATQAPTPNPTGSNSKHTKNPKGAWSRPPPSTWPSAPQDPEKIAKAEFIREIRQQ